MLCVFFCCCSRATAHALSPACCRGAWLPAGVLDVQFDERATRDTDLCPSNTSACTLQLTLPLGPGADSSTGGELLCVHLEQRAASSGPVFTLSREDFVLSSTAASSGQAVS